MQELRDRLAAKSIHVCLIQETKLAEKHVSPPFPGYKSIRVDHRTTHWEGGLLTLVKEFIVSQQAAQDYSPPLERLTAPIQLSRRRWVMIHNLYVAKVKGPASSESLALSSVGPFALTAGGLNARSSLRDEHQPADQRGEAVQD